MEDLENHSCTG